MPWPRFRSRSAPVASLEERWMARWNRLRECLALGPALIPAGEELLARHRLPGRPAHDAAGVLFRLEALDSHGGRIEDGDAVELATWYRYAAWDPRSDPDANAAGSAAVFGESFAPLAGHWIDCREVERLIRAHPDAEDGARGDAALVADLDRAILAADPRRYDGHVADLRRERADLAEEAWRRRRMEELRQLLARPRVFATRSFHRAAGKAARANLIREWQALLDAGESAGD